MRILLDETLDCRLDRSLPGHEVRSLAHLGWSGIQDRELLELARRAFDVLLTTDGTLRQARRAAKRPLAIVALQARSSRLPDTRPLMGKVLKLLPVLQPGKVMMVSA